MNQQIHPQYLWWLNAVSGNRQPLPTNQEPQSGYYRDGDRAIAIWRQDGRILHTVTEGHRFRSLDTLNDAFGRFCMRPIMQEAYYDRAAGKSWPEDPTPHIDAAKAPEDPRIGHNSALPHELARDELDAIRKAYAYWLKSVGGKITTEEHSALAKGFQDRAQAVEKEIKAKHEAEKAPFLAAGREVDARWITGPGSVKAVAESLKKAIGADRTPYLVEKDRQAKEEQKRIAEERERHRQEQARKLTEGGSVNAPAAPPPAPRPAATGLRTYYSVKITDMDALFGMPGVRSDPDVIAAIEKVAKRMLVAKADVRGAELIEDRRA